MPMDRASFEGELVDRCGRWIREAELSADPGADATPRRYLNAPLRYGLQSCGLDASDPFAVSDADLASVATASVERFMDHAQYRCIENIYHNYTKVTRSLGQASVSASDFGNRLAGELERLWGQIVERYGVAPQRMLSGTIPMPASVARPPTPYYPSELPTWPYGTLPPPPWGA